MNILICLWITINWVFITQKCQSKTPLKVSFHPMISVSLEYGSSLIIPSMQLQVSKPLIKCHLNSNKNTKNLLRKLSNWMPMKTPTQIVHNPQQITHLITENDITSCLMLSFIIYFSFHPSETPKLFKIGKSFHRYFFIFFPTSRKVLIWTSVNKLPSICPFIWLNFINSQPFHPFSVQNLFIFSHLSSLWFK